MVGDQHRTIAELAHELGVNDETLGNSGAPGTQSTAVSQKASPPLEREESTRLGRQVKQLTMERELAKRAMAHSVKEGRQ